jgi:thiol:disulfide interchange protein DsbD
VIDYGYQDSVLLPVELQTPRTALAAGSSVTLSAEVRWVVCHDVCLSGQATLTLSLPVRAEPGSESASHGLFREAGARLPKPMPPAWKAEATSGKDVFVLTVQGAGGAGAFFFPLQADQIDNVAPQTTTMLPGGLRLTLKKSDQLLKMPDKLDGVLELGKGQVYAVTAPVRALPE